MRPVGLWAGRTRRTAEMGRAAIESVSIRRVADDFTVGL